MPPIARQVSAHTPGRTLREYRMALGLSQQAFAAELGINAETYRVLDSGRRPTPAALLIRAQTLVTYRSDEYSCLSTSWLP